MTHYTCHVEGCETNDPGNCRCTFHVMGVDITIWLCDNHMAQMADDSVVHIVDSEGDTVWEQGQRMTDQDYDRLGWD